MHTADPLMRNTTDVASAEPRGPRTIARKTRLEPAKARNISDTTNGKRWNRLSGELPHGPEPPAAACAGDQNLFTMSKTT